jgi:hypothetical protein
VHSLSGGGTVTVADIQIVINAVVGNGCVTSGN